MHTTMPPSLAPFLVTGSATVKEAMKRMDEAEEKVVFVVDEDRRLLGALTGGDVRRWILKEGSLNEKVIRACCKKPFAVRCGYDLESVRAQMVSRRITGIPVVDGGRRVIDILLWKNILDSALPKAAEKLSLPIVIMAGGKGVRMDPFTRILPKPLIPIGNKPIIEIIMDRFSSCGIRDFFVSVNYKAQMIKAYFGEAGTGYNIRYVEEKKPLGTAGSLRQLRRQLDGTFIVTNCDIIIEDHYPDIVKYHRASKNDITIVGSYKRSVIPYGVCKIENGGTLREIEEKPEYDFLANTGMYVVERPMLDLIPAGKVFHFTDLIRKAKAKGAKIGVFPISEKAWIDIGQWEEYRKAVDAFCGRA